MRSLQLRRVILYSSVLLLLFLFMFLSMINVDTFTAIIHIQSEDDKFFEEWDTIQQMRKDMALQHCSKLYPHSREEISLPESQQMGLFEAFNIIWQREMHLALCRHGKVATTTWMRLFNEISNITWSLETVHESSVTSFAPTLDIVFADALWVTMVRHPLTRLASAYRDKMKSDYKVDWYETAIRKYRPQQNELTFSKWKNLSSLIGIDVSEKPTFWEFMKVGLHDIRSRCRYVHRMINPCSSTPDVHWLPYFVRCSPCVYDFHIIAKTETFQKDIRYLKLKILKLLDRESRMEMNIAHIAQMLDIMRNIHEHKSHGITTEEITRKIMTILTAKEKEELKSVYEYDFNLFDYNADEYG